MDTSNKKKPATQGDLLEEQNKPDNVPEKGKDSPDVVEASEKDVQEAQYGDRSYASPDFGK